MNINIHSTMTNCSTSPNKHIYNDVFAYIIDISDQEFTDTYGFPFWNITIAKDGYKKGITIHFQTPHAKDIYIEQPLDCIHHEDINAWNLATKKTYSSPPFGYTFVQHIFWKEAYLEPIADIDLNRLLYLFESRILKATIICNMLTKNLLEDVKKQVDCLKFVSNSNPNQLVNRYHVVRLLDAIYTRLKKYGCDSHILLGDIKHFL